jgi:inosine-uridine nucleoside N-ribohydrolase
MKWSDRIAAIGTKPAKFVMELMDFFQKTYKDAQGFDFPPVHDPCAVAYVIDPTVMTTRKVPVDIELQGKLTLGMTVADFRAPAPEDCHTVRRRGPGPQEVLGSGHRRHHQDWRTNARRPARPRCADVTETAETVPLAGEAK